MATRTIAAAGGNFGVAATYDEVASPTSADDVVARGGGDSGNLTINSSVACRSLDLTNYAATLAYSGTNRVLSIGDASGGLLKLVAGMTVTLATAARIEFVSTATGNAITTAGKTLRRVVFDGVGGSWLLQDAMLCDGNATLNNGTLDLNGNGLTCLGVVTGTGTKVLAMGSQTVTLTSTTAPINNAVPTGLTITGTGTFHISDTSAADKIITGGGSTFPNLSFATGGAGAANKITFADSSTFSRRSTLTGGPAVPFRYTTDR